MPLEYNVPLGAQSWFRCGGKADKVLTVESIQELQSFLKNNQEPYITIGGMANTIIRDGGIRETVIRFGKGMNNVSPCDHAKLKAEAGTLNGSLAAAALKNNIGGLEFLSGIPGTLGGAIAMNAGAYGTEIKDVLVDIKIIDANGDMIVKTPKDLNMTYRHTNIDTSQIVVAATLKGINETYETIKERLNSIKKKRNDTQPIKEKTGGSTFANPNSKDLKLANLPETTRAWEIVDMVGGRGLKIGDAQMSEKHCNFMVNAGNATASDLENLGDELIQRAKNQLGVTLKWEIKRIGEHT